MAKKKAEAVQKTNWDVLVEDSKSFWNNTVMKNQILFGIGTAVLLILAVVLYGMIGGDSDAPDFTLKDTDGNTFSLSDYEGEKVVILDFMFSTCAPCEKFVQESLGPYAETMDKDEVIIISISVFENDDEKTLKDTFNSHRLTHSVAPIRSSRSGKGIQYSFLLVS